MIALEQDWGIERGFRIEPTNPSLKTLAPALVHWIAYIERYCMFMSDDSPYWHSERASVSTFAAAIWAAGGVATQEIPMPKERGQSPQSTPHADLFFEFGGESYLVEAKSAYNQTNGIAAEKVYHEAELEKVCREAKEQIESRCTSPIKGRDMDSFRKLVMIFFAPGFVVDKEMTKETIKQTLIKYRKQIHDDGKFDLSCWCFPRLDQTKPLTDFKDKLQYPGVMLAAKLIS